MKVLIVSHTYSEITHGPAKFVRLLMELEEEYSEIDLRVLTEAPVKDQRVYPIRVKVPRPLHAAIKLIRGVRYHRAALKIRREFAFDYLIYNDGITGFWSALKLQDHVVKVIVMVNDDEYLRVGQNRVLPWRKKVIAKVHRFLERLAVRKATVCLTCSDYLKHTVEQIYSPNAGQVKTLYQGVRLPIPFDDNRVQPWANPIRILFVKSNPEIGGLPILLEALSRLSQYQFYLSVVGPPKQWLDRYRTLISRGGLEVFFHGPLPQASLFHLMETYDLLCTPSLLEGLGVANIEGLAHGITVISSDVGGIREVLGGGALGWLAKPGDAEDLAVTIHMALNSDIQLRRQKAMMGRKAVESQFTADRMIQNLIQILNDV